MKATEYNVEYYTHRLNQHNEYFKYSTDNENLIMVECEGKKYVLFQIYHEWEIEEYDGTIEQYTFEIVDGCDHYDGCDIEILETLEIKGKNYATK